MLTTHKIKAILTMMGHTGIKLRAKRSNAALTYREFISNTASIVVRSTVDGISIVQNTSDCGLFIKFDTSGNSKEVLCALLY